MLRGDALGGGAAGGAGAVAGARVALGAVLGGSVGGFGGGAHKDVSLGVLAVSVDKAVSDRLGVLHRN